MKTIKLPYRCVTQTEHERVLEYVKNYNSVLRFTYNRVLEDPTISTKDLTVLQKSMANVFVDSWFRSSAQYDAKALIRSNEGKKVVFGGRALFGRRQRLKITHDEFVRDRLVPLCSVGEAAANSNRKFQVRSSNVVVFKPNRYESFELLLPRLHKNYKEELEALVSKQGEFPITYRLDAKHVYISYEEFDVGEARRVISDRVFAIDLNPNYVGWSVVDWVGPDEPVLVASGVFDLRALNDKYVDAKTKKYLTNKRQYELVKVADDLVNEAVHFGCETFAIERLDVRPGDRGLGAHFNWLCNNVWCRGLFTNQLRKRCKLNRIGFMEVAAVYSSFVGNLAYRRFEKPDQVLASMEIGRRAYELDHQYTKKDKKIEKNIVLNESEANKTEVLKSLEELGYRGVWFSLKDLYYKLKTLEMKYRVPLDAVPVVCSKNHLKKMLTTYVF